MKKLIALTLCTVMTLARTTCGVDSKEESPIIGGDPAIWGSENNKNVEILNPFTEYETLVEAIKACGFDFSVPNTVSGYENKQFAVIDNKLIQVIYFNKYELSKLDEEELNNVNWETVNFNPNSLLIRKAVGNDDISGDYNEYEEINTISVSDLEVTTKGNDGTVNVAIWTNNGYTFAITTNNSMSGEQISKLIKSIQ